MINDVFFADLCERILRLCKLQEDEVMVVVDEPVAEPSATRTRSWQPPSGWVRRPTS